MSVPPSLIPELAVTDWQASKRFYCDILGFSVAYERPEDGFAKLTMGDAHVMIDQIGTGRTFDDGHLPDAYPFGRGMNLQIKVPAVAPALNRLHAAQYPIYLAREDKWYRKDALEVGNRQFVVADPDGYLIRLFQDLGKRTPKPDR